MNSPSFTHTAHYSPVMIAPLSIKSSHADCALFFKEPGDCNLGHLALETPDLDRFRRPRPHPFEDRNQLAPGALWKQPAAHPPVLGRLSKGVVENDGYALVFCLLSFRLSPRRSGE